MRGSIPGRVIPKILKMVLDASLLNTQHYKVWILGVVAIEKGAFRSYSTTVANFFYLYTTSFTYAEDNFFRFAGLPNKRLTAPNITPQLNQFREKNVNIHCMKKTLWEAEFYGRIAVKKSLIKKENNVKRYQ